MRLLQQRGISPQRRGVSPRHYGISPHQHGTSPRQATSPRRALSPLPFVRMCAEPGVVCARPAVTQDAFSTMVWPAQFGVPQHASFQPNRVSTASGCPSLEELEAKYSPSKGKSHGTKKRQQLEKFKEGLMTGLEDDQVGCKARTFEEIINKYGAGSKTREAVNARQLEVDSQMRDRLSSVDDKVSQLREELSKLLDQNRRLEADNAHLRTDNACLKLLKDVTDDGCSSSVSEIDSADSCHNRRTEGQFVKHLNDKQDSCHNLRTDGQFVKHRNDIQDTIRTPSFSAKAGKDSGNRFKSSLLGCSSLLDKSFGLEADNAQMRTDNAFSKLQSPMKEDACMSSLSAKVCGEFGCYGFETFKHPTAIQEDTVVASADSHNAFESLKLGIELKEQKGMPSSSGIVDADFGIGCQASIPSKTPEKSKYANCVSTPDVANGSTNTSVHKLLQLIDTPPTPWRVSLRGDGSLSPTPSTSRRMALREEFSSPTRKFKEDSPSPTRSLRELRKTMDRISLKDTSRTLSTSLFSSQL